MISAISLPEHEKYKVQVRIANLHWETKEDPTMIKGSNYNRWNENVAHVFKNKSPQLEYESEEQKIAHCKFRLPYHDIANIETVFVYLMQKFRVGGWKRICFYKAPIAEFMDMNASVEWIEMNPDLAIGEVKEHYKAGILGVRLSLWDVTNNGGPANWNNYPNWVEKLKKRPKIIKVRAYIFQARDLPAADENGSSDPFARIQDCGTTQDTKTIFDNTNPIWYETLELGYEAANINDMPPIVVDTYDMDICTIGSPDLDFLARTVLYARDIRRNTDDDPPEEEHPDPAKPNKPEEFKLPYSENSDVPKPVWYPMVYKKGDPTSGEILMSFSIVDDDYTFRVPNEKKVNLPKEAGIIMQEYNCLLNILGLRNLQSPGVLPVKKASIYFNLQSMLGPDAGSAIENIKTEPSAPGADPTLNTLIEFDIELPTDKLYCPRMACRVNDNVLMGWN